MDESFWGDLRGHFEFSKEKFKNHDHSNVDKRVTVAVRCRPLDPREKSMNNKSIVTPRSDGTITMDMTKIIQGMDSVTFAFDFVYGPESSQLDVFETIGYDAVEHAFMGYNVSIFAYGQTSSGKTHSMMGIPHCEDVGLIPRICHSIFKFVGLSANEYETYEASIEASYLEIYNEKPRDLLVDPSRAHALQVRESPEVGVFVEGLSRHKVGSAYDVESLIASGTKYRTIASTKYNRESSRSHAVFEITLIQVFQERNNPLTLQKRSKLNLIDLAGSERTGKIGNKGIVFDEGASINKSLTVLGRCIKALSKMKRGSRSNKSVSVPFRESVLTWYLRESLAGNAKTTMLATVSPADSNGNETYGTLRYAAEAKRIETVVHMNEDAVQKQLRQQQEEIMKLREQLDWLEKQRPNDSNAFEIAERETLISAMEELKRSSWEAVKNSDMCYVNELFDDIGFPALVTLSPDPMLSGKLRYCLNKQKKPTSLSSSSLASNVSDQDLAFKIGRAVDSDLELDGVGICAQHCHIEPLSDSGESESKFGLRVFSDAKVHLNGALIPPNDTSARHLVPLKHGDRLVLGPCRFVAVFIEHETQLFPNTNMSQKVQKRPSSGVRNPMIINEEGIEEDGFENEPDSEFDENDDENVEKYEYSAVVSEMLHGSGSGQAKVPRMFGSSDTAAEGKLWDELVRALEMVAQANEIASEMLVKVEFCAELATTLSSDFEESQMHSLPSLGANVIIRCRSIEPMQAQPPGSPRSPRNLSSSSFSHKAVNSFHASSVSHSTEDALQRLFDISLEEFEDLLAELRDLHMSNAVLCNVLRRDGVSFIDHVEYEDFLSATHQHDTEDNHDSGHPDPDHEEKSGSSSSSSSKRLQSPPPLSIKTPHSATNSPNGRSKSSKVSDELLLLFQSCDENLDGHLSFTEFLPAMKHFGFSPQPEKIKFLFDAFISHPDNDGLSITDLSMFLRTLMLLKFTGIIAHLVTNSIAFGEFLRVDPSIKRRYSDLYPPTSPSSSNNNSPLVSPSNSANSSSSIPNHHKQQSFDFLSNISSPTSSSNSDFGFANPNHSQSLSPPPPLSPNSYSMMTSHLKKAPKSKYPFYNKPHIFIQYVLKSELFSEEGRIITIHALTWDATPPPAAISSPSEHPLSSASSQNRYSAYLTCPNLVLPIHQIEQRHKEEELHRIHIRDNQLKLGIAHATSGFRDKDGFEDKNMTDNSFTSSKENDFIHQSKHLLAVSLGKLFDCDPSHIILHEDENISIRRDTDHPYMTGNNNNNDDDDHHTSNKSAANGFPTVSATISGVSDMVIGNAVSCLINLDLNHQKESALKLEELNQRLKKKRTKISELENELLDLKSRPEGLGKVAEVLYASNSKVARLLSDLKQLCSLDDAPSDETIEAMHKKYTNTTAFSNTTNTSNTLKVPNCSDASQKVLKSMVTTLASLLKAANTRVARALDNEDKLKETLGRLDAKVQQVISHKRGKDFASTSEHRQLLKELLDARKQTAALAKDNSVGRLARAAAQEHQLEDDLSDILKEREVKFPGRTRKTPETNLNESDAVNMDDLQFESICAREEVVRGELQRLKAKNAKLISAVEERKMAIARDIANVEDRIKSLDSSPKSDTDWSIEELKAKNSRMKQRMIAAEESCNSMLQVLSSDAWSLVPIGAKQDADPDSDSGLATPSEKSSNLSAWSEVVSSGLRHPLSSPESSTGDGSPDKTFSPDKTPLSPPTPPSLPRTPTRRELSPVRQRIIESSPSQTIRIVSPFPSPSHSHDSENACDDEDGAHEGRGSVYARKKEKESSRWEKEEEVDKNRSNIQLDIEVKNQREDKSLENSSYDNNSISSKEHSFEDISEDVMKELNELKELRGRRQDREASSKQRLASVQRRIGESSDLQLEASQLISQTELRMNRLNEIRQRLDAAKHEMESKGNKATESKNGVIHEEDEEDETY